MEIVNCTPHAVQILDPTCCEFSFLTRSFQLTGEQKIMREIPPSGICPRCKQDEHEIDPIDGIPVIGVTFGEIEGLPEEKEGTFLIVSAIVATAGRKQGRKDLLIPSRLVRNYEGKIMGCLALAAE